MITWSRKEVKANAKDRFSYAALGTGGSMADVSTVPGGFILFVVTKHCLGNCLLLLYTATYAYRIWVQPHVAKQSDRILCCEGFV